MDWTNSGELLAVAGKFREIAVKSNHTIRYLNVLHFYNDIGQMVYKVDIPCETVSSPVHSSEIRDLSSMKCSSETLQNWLCLKKIQAIFFLFFISCNFTFSFMKGLVYVDIIKYSKFLSSKFQMKCIQKKKSKLL